MFRIAPEDATGSKIIHLEPPDSFQIGHKITLCGIYVVPMSEVAGKIPRKHNLSHMQ